MDQWSVYTVTLGLELFAFPTAVNNLSMMARVIEAQKLSITQTEPKVSKVQWHSTKLGLDIIQF